MNFRVGQKVVCVDDSPRDERPVHVVKGHVYTIGSFCPLWGRKAVYLIEATAADNNPFWADRFRPIVERKTDISVFTDILRKVTKHDRVDA